MSCGHAIVAGAINLIAGAGLGGAMAAAIGLRGSRGEALFLGGLSLVASLAGFTGLIGGAP